MTTAKPLARYRAIEGALASGFVTAKLHHAAGHDLPITQIIRQILRSSFYVFYLHEQFHHKVESLGLRLLVGGKVDRYRPYKSNVDRRVYMTTDCLEESLANADSFRRLREDHYLKRFDTQILGGLRAYLRMSIPMQPPGYAEGINYLTPPSYQRGLRRLQSQILDGLVTPKTPTMQWSAAPNMITALADITEDIYIIVPKGARPIFTPQDIDPGYTVSSRVMEVALTRHHGYRIVSGGKGSHVKLEKTGAPPIIVPGNRKVLSPGFVKHVLRTLGDYPISRLPELLNGELASDR